MTAAKHGFRMRRGAVSRIIRADFRFCSPMNVLFEEDGAFKAGTVLADNTTSLQVELPSGKRSKVKSSSVLLRFTAPDSDELMRRAETEAETLDVEFLWEVCGEDEFGFEDLARDYHGTAPDAVQSAAVLLRLHAAPIYFHRKGKGRFRKAPEDILRAALAGLEKKRLQQQTMDAWRDELLAGRTPPEIAAQLSWLLYKPDRNRMETKAVEAAAAEAGLSIVHLLARTGALASSHDYHLGRFLHDYFPRGTDFPDYAPAHVPDELVTAPVRAFSIDDHTTTEIDDAFSVQPLPEGGWRVGIHIAAPGLGFAPSSALGDIARTRLSTVYFPGRKITMLPDAVVEQFTLAAGRECPALSLYLDIAPDLRLRSHHSRVEKVPVIANLRLHELEPLFNEDTLCAQTVPSFEFRDELLLLWRLAEVFEAGRGKPSANQNFFDFSFYVNWDAHSDDGPGRVDIVQRRRGSPLDKLVAELMIVANSTWGALLRDAGIPGMYRAQSAGKVRMTTVAAPHEGLGVECYAWSTSPLRRYTDLSNQWQLISLIEGRDPVFPPRSEALMSALRDFELAYTAYAEFQRGMERYWCLRWLRQQANDIQTARVIRESLICLESAPLFLRCPSLPGGVQPRERVQVQIEQIDLLDNEARVRFAAVLPPLADASSADADTDEVQPGAGGAQ